MRRRLTAAAVCISLFLAGFAAAAASASATACNTTLFCVYGPTWDVSGQSGFLGAQASLRVNSSSMYTDGSNQITEELRVGHSHSLADPFAGAAIFEGPFGGTVYTSPVWMLTFNIGNGQEFIADPNSLGAPATYNPDTYVSVDVHWHSSGLWYITVGSLPPQPMFVSMNGPSGNPQLAQSLDAVEESQAENSSMANYGSVSNLDWYDSGNTLRTGWSSSSSNANMIHTGTVYLDMCGEWVDKPNWARVWLHDGRATC